MRIGLMGASNTTVDKDLGWKKIIAEYQKAKGAHVKIGIQGEKAASPKKEHDGRKSNFKVIDVAVVHEFGSTNGNIPERSFIRSTFDRKAKKEWTDFTKKLIAQIVLRKMTVSQALTIMGEKGRADTRETIQKSIGIKVLKAATIKRKGSSTPLIDTGQLVNSITYEKVLK